MDEVSQQWHGNRNQEKPPAHCHRQETTTISEPTTHNRIQRREQRVHVSGRGLLFLQGLPAQATSLPINQHQAETELHVHSALAHTELEQL